MRRRHNWSTTKVRNQTRVGFKSWHNLPDEAFKLSFGFLHRKMGTTPTFQGNLRIEKMYLKCPAQSRQSTNENYHHYYHRETVSGMVTIWETTWLLVNT